MERQCNECIHLSQYATDKASCFPFFLQVIDNIVMYIMYWIQPVLQTGCSLSFFQIGLDIQYLPSFVVGWVLELWVNFMCVQLVLICTRLLVDQKLPLEAITHSSNIHTYIHTYIYIYFQSLNTKVCSTEPKSSQISHSNTSRIIWKTYY